MAKSLTAGQNRNAVQRAMQKADFTEINETMYNIKQDFINIQKKGNVVGK